MTNYTDIPDIAAGNETTSLLSNDKARKKDYIYLKVACAGLLMVVTFMLGGRSNMSNLKENPSVLGGAKFVPIDQLKPIDHGDHGGAEFAVIGDTNTISDGEMEQLEAIQVAYKECPRKMVSLYKFCAGDDDPGHYEEHLFRVDGKPLNTVPYEIKYKTCDMLNFEPILVEKWKSLTVGTIEVDNEIWGVNDHYSGVMNGNDWYSKTCEPYEVIIEIPYALGYDFKGCWNVEGSASGEYKGVEGEIKLGYEECTSYTQPEKSYQFFMKVEPTNDEVDHRNDIVTNIYNHLRNAVTRRYLGFNVRDWVTVQTPTSNYAFVKGDRQNTPVLSGEWYYVTKSGKYMYEDGNGDVAFSARPITGRSQWIVRKVNAPHGTKIKVGDRLTIENVLYPKNFLVDYDGEWAAAGTYARPKVWIVY